MNHKKFLSLFIVFAIICSIFIKNPIIVPSALEDDEIEITNEEDVEDEGEPEKAHEHNYGEWIIDVEPTTESEGSKHRACDCGDIQTESIDKLEVPEKIEDEEYIEKEESVVNITTDLLDEKDPALLKESKAEVEKEEDKFSTIYISVSLDGFSGDVIFTAYDGDNNTINSKTLNSSSSTNLKIPSGKYSKIVCKLDGANSENAATTFYSAEGDFDNESYYINVKVTYKAPCTHTNTTQKIEKEATYKEEGLLENICNDCGGIVSTETIPKLTCSHLHTSDTTIKEATEKTSGKISTRCDDCGKFLGVHDSTKKEHKHNYKSSKIEATCAQEGYNIEICSVCGDIKINDTIEKKSHTWDSGIVKTEATCTNDGLIEYTCTACNATRTENIPALAHDYVIKSTVDATCAAPGKIIYVCSHCGDTFDTNIAKLETHDWTGQYTTIKEPTCTHAGKSELRCKVCNEVLDTVTVEKLPHDCKWVESKAATTSETGLEEYKCKVCGEVTDTKVIPKIEKDVCKHPSDKYVYTVLEPATCSSYKYVKVTCGECGEVVFDRIKQGNSYDTNNHVSFTDTVTKNASYKEAGTIKHTCDGCGYSYTEEIPRLVCNHEKTGVYYRPGYDKSWKKCEICDEYLYEVEGSGVVCNHSGYAKTEIVRQQATETEWGIVDYVCEHCGQVTTTKKIHPYKEYQIKFEDGHTETVYGWFDQDYAQEVFKLTNQYRKENGLNELHYNSSLQWAAEQRALEASVDFRHYRPGSDTRKWNTVASEWQYGGENIASGQKTPTTAMSAWKRSPGHNKNLLFGINDGEINYKGLSVGVFHKMVFVNTTKIPTETIVWSQNFTFYEY